MQLLHQAALAGSIKFAGAGLLYGLFASVALVTTGYEFGLFSMTFAASSLAASFVLAGQNSAAMKIWPKYAARGRVATGDSFIRYGWAVYGMVSGIFTATIATYLAAVHMAGIDQAHTELWICFIALTLTLSMAEYLAMLLRIQGKIGSALIPRDIVWRAGSAALLCGIYLTELEIPAMAVCTLLTLALLLTTGCQYYISREALQFTSGYKLSHFHKAHYRRLSGYLWASSMLQQASIHFSTVMVGLIIDPVSAGAYFAADKTSQLVALALLGFNQAIGPQLSGLFHGGSAKRDELRKLVLKISTGSTVFGCLVAILLFISGKQLLGIFDRSYVTAEFYLVLLILAAGRIGEAYFGSAPLLLQLAGEHKVFTNFTAYCNLASLILICVFSVLFGVIGASIASVIGTVSLALLSSRHSAKVLRIDTRPRLRFWARSAKTTC